MSVLTDYVEDDNNVSKIDTQKVYDIVLSSTDAEISLEKVNAKSNLRSDLGFDSISYMTLALHLERQFGLKISDIHVEYYRIKTVGDIISLLNNKVGKENDQ